MNKKWYMNDDNVKFVLGVGFNFTTFDENGVNSIKHEDNRYISFYWSDEISPDSLFWEETDELFDIKNLRSVIYGRDDLPLLTKEECRAITHLLRTEKWGGSYYCGPMARKILNIVEIPSLSVEKRKIKILLIVSVEKGKHKQKFSEIGT